MHKYNFDELKKVANELDALSNDESTNTRADQQIEKLRKDVLPKLSKRLRDALTSEQEHWEKSQLHLANGELVDDFVPKEVPLDPEVTPEEE